jgi:hypothetical protein
MSHSMNGKAVWCRPARTREYDFAPKDPNDGADQRLAILAEAAQLVAAGIRAGLVHTAESLPPEPKRSYVGRRSVLAVCDTCGLQFARGHTSLQPTCFSCRLPSRPCKSCGKDFKPLQRKQVVCSMACKVDICKAAAAKRVEAQRDKFRIVPCPVCGVDFKQLFTASKATKTCSRPCGVLLMSRTTKGRTRTK